MDAATRSLHCYHTARLLHLVPQFFSAQEENCFLVPLFYPCVSTEAKRYARLVLLCLLHRMGPTYSPEVGLHVLSFLAFPELCALRAQISVPPPLLTMGAKRQRADETPSQTEKRPRKEKETESNDLNVPPPRVFGDEDVSNVGGELQLEGDIEKNSNADKAEEDESDQTDQLYFFVHPLPSSSQVTRLFVRMVAQNPLNEETMNTFFGRYGQVSCELQSQRPFPGDEHGRLMQDFLVMVDSHVNALRAVREAYYRELAFIALSDPAHNTHRASDVDSVLGHLDVEIFNEKPRRLTGEGEGEGDGEGDDAAALALRSFVPDIVVDGLPYWLTVDQLRASFSEYGRVVDVRISVDDRSGAFNGAALLRMASVEEALAASEGLNGAVLKGNELVSGVLDDRLNIVSLRQGTIIRRADKMFPEDCDITENERMWV